MYQSVGLFRALAVCLLLSPPLAGCGVLVTAAASIRDQAPPVGEDLAQDPLMQSLASRFAFMALLSDVVYYRDGTEVGPSCSERTGGADLATTAFLGQPRPEGRWERAANQQGLSFCLDHPSGLYYETFVFRTRAGRVTEAVIVFRGTEGADLRDWGSNLSAFAGLEPPQYRAALDALEPVMDALQRGQYVGAAVYVAGHSLGGGLAQQAAYRFDAVRAAYTFNTSPVTNWSWMVLRGESPQQHWPVIYRVYHTGEALHYVRNVTTLTTATRYNRHDIGLQLRPRSAITGHAITVIACGLSDVIVRGGLQDNPHHYSLASATAALGRPVCRSYTQPPPARRTLPPSAGYHASGP